MNASSGGRRSVWGGVVVVVVRSPVRATSAAAAVIGIYISAVTGRRGIGRRWIIIYRRADEWRFLPRR